MANRPGGADNTLTATATDLVTLNPTIWFDPPVVFPMGVSQATVYAMDAAFNTSWASFTVTVVPAALMIYGETPADQSFSLVAQPVISATVTATNADVDWSTVTVTLDGNAITPALNGTGFTYTPTEDLAQGEP